MKVEQRLVQGQRGFDVGAVGDAEPQHVLSGKRFSSENGADIEGAMPNNGPRNGTIITQGGQIAIPAGYTTGGTISASFPNLTPANVKEGVNVGGVVGTLTPMPVPAPGEIIHYRVDTSTSRSSSQWTIVSTVTVHVTGTYRIEFSAMNNWSGDDCAIQVWKNGSPYGSAMGPNSDTVPSVWNENLLFNAGDLIQIAVRAYSGSIIYRGMKVKANVRAFVG